jgi:hypothetical protein
MELVVVMYQAPIPIGHHVEIVWYEIIETGLLGKKAKSWPHEPLITDNNTGIEYASERWLASSGVKHGSRPVEVGDELMAGARVLQRLKGVVRKCRVVTVRGHEYDVQTSLTIEPEAGTATTLVNYRP